MKPILLFFSLLIILFDSNAQIIDRAMKHYKAKEYSQAIPDFEKAIPLIAKEYGKQDTVYYARLLLYTAISYENVYNFENAKEYFIQCNEVFVSSGAIKNPLYARSCINLANVYNAYGKFQEALKLNLKAQSIYESISGKKSSDYALACNNIAAVYKNTENYNKSEKLFIEAKDIYKSLYGKKHPDYTVCCNNLASLYQKEGKYNKAEQLFIEAKDIDESLYGRESRKYAEDCNNLAVLYVELGNYEKAEPLFIIAEKVLRRNIDTHGPKYAKVCNNLGQLFLMNKDYKNAERFFLKAKMIYKKLYGISNSDYLMVCNNLASLYFEKSDFENAENLFIEVLNADKNNLGNKHSIYANDCNNLAALYYYKGKYKKAIPLYLESKNIFKNIYGEKHYNYALACSNLALVYSAMGNYKKAEVLFENANSILNFLSLESSSFMSEREREAYLNTNIIDNLDIYNSFFLDNKDKHKELTGIVYNNALNLKGQLLKSSLVIRKTIVQTKDKDLISLYKKMNRIGKELAEQFSLPIKDKRKDMQNLEEQKNNIEKELVRKSQKFGIINNSEKLKWEDIQKSLSENETAIEFINFRYHSEEFQTNKNFYYALIIQKKYEYPKAVFLFEEKKLQKLLYRAPNLSEYNYIKNLYDPKSKSAKSLYDLVWKPISEVINKTSNIYISPSGLLNRISFDALPIDTVSLLSDKYKIIYTSSTSELCNKLGLYQKDIKNSVLFGGIKYDMSIEEMEKQSKRFKSYKTSSDSIWNIKTNTNNFNKIVSDSLVRGLTWSYLPGSLDETVDIKEVILKKDIKAQVYKDEFGSEEQFKALENDAPSILHISTHGFYFGDDEESDNMKSMISNRIEFAHSENPLMRSGFILAGGNIAFQGGKIPEGVEDGVLTAMEISQLNLFNTKLVVLSACQTGLGDVKGHEGVYGLQRSFKMAGVDYLLFSLWSVPDEATKELMEDFYKNWFNGMEIRAAFKEAQNQLKEKYEGVSGAAFAWAAFVLKK